MKASHISKLACYLQVPTLLMCIAVFTTSSVFAQTADDAGKVLMAIGEVKVVRKGQSIALTRGAPIQSGDTLVTGVASNAQIRMSDGAIIALRAQTEFKIDEYKYNGKQDGSEKASLSLVKGGVRAVTGAIGQQNKDNLQVNAVVATVGIRGTGFNINYCDGNCFNPNKTPAKDGLYAGVFEGQITVKNEATTDTLGVNQFLYVADKNTAPVRLSTPPNFLPDPLSGQKSTKKDKSNAADIPSLNVAVAPPREAADSQVSPPFSPLLNVGGVVINQAPAITVTGSFNPPTTWYNKTNLGDGNVLASGYTNYLQLAEVYPNSTTLVNGLPPNNIGTYVAASTPTNPNESPNPSQTPPIIAGTGFQVTNSGTNQTQITLSSSYGVVDPATGVPYVVPTVPPSAIPVNYQIGTAQQMEGGNYNGVVSWGRWANGTMYQVAAYGYNGAPNSYINAVNLPEGSGFHYIAGQLANIASVAPNSNFTFNLLGASTPTAVSNPQGSWYVTGGTLNANFATRSPSISGNLTMFTSQTAGYANYNMAFSGAGSTNTPLAQTAVTTAVSKVNGTLATCAGGCAGNGNVAFYGSNTSPQAAGLSYNFNTGSNIVQGVAVFKR